ncbi:MAG TPA: UDP-N-acetylmuramoyl-L-alanyl-D-glutamate--2,6-diaminopimelate ligase, partial [Chloroflexi bacterium]|nr:UDP-N-acetylmuramoyl-L-alanyl-D-glutamate--2,6-diaminopimelate ligase [Chloroflexota bacterium]
MKRLSKLLEKVDWISCSNDSDTEIVSVVQDSDNVEPGSVFVARVGLISDGHQYIELALKNGANAIVGELSFENVRHLFNTKVPYVQVARSSEALAWLAAALNDFPSEKLVLIGVTGTDGKTTTCNIIYSILQAAGVSTGLITTVNAVVGDDIYDTGFHVTTPDAVALQDLLAQMVSSEITHCVVEVTSHALVQDRVASCEFDMAVLTNVTHEHLDYHGTFLEYMQAKELLINQVDRSTGNKLVILNYDD